MKFDFSTPVSMLNFAEHDPAYTVPFDYVVMFVYTNTCVRVRAYVQTCGRISVYTQDSR